MGTYVYVGNLASTTTENAIRDTFTSHGSSVKSVVVMRSPQNDRSRGFGFVELESEEEAQAAMRDLNGVELEGRPLKVDTARPAAPARELGRSFDGGPRHSGARRPGGAARRKRG